MCVANYKTIDYPDMYSIVLVKVAATLSGNSTGVYKTSTSQRDGISVENV